MNKLYRLDPGFVEDTVIYELVPREVGRLKTATLRETEAEMKRLGVKFVLIDSGYPEIIERLGRLSSKEILKRMMTMQEPEFIISKGRLPLWKK